MNAISRISEYQPQRWHVLCTESQRELHALRWLIRIEQIAYGPLSWEFVQHGRGKQRIVVKPMINGYLFIREPKPEHWQSIEEVYGIRSRLQIGEKQATVSGDAIEALRCAEMLLNLGILKDHHRYSHNFRIGDTVKTTEEAGAFAGYQGLVRRLDKNDHIVLEAVLPARLQTIVLPAQWLKAV